MSKRKHQMESRGGRGGGARQTPGAGVMSITVKWNRSHQGWCHSKCGGYEISPIFKGNTQVCYRMTALRSGPLDMNDRESTVARSMREAKNHAQQHHDRKLGVRTVIKWKKSEDGYVDSVCGEYQIKPNFLGRCKAIGYYLKWWDRRTNMHELKSLFYEQTQRQAKAQAQKHRDNLNDQAKQSRP